MSKYIVIKDCIDSKGNFLAKNEIIEDFDEKVEEKLLNLKLVEEYDAKKHKVATYSKDAEIEELNKTLAAKDAEIEELNKTLAAKDAEIEELKTLVLETSKLAINKLPKGFEKYKGEE